MAIYCAVLLSPCGTTNVINYQQYRLLPCHNEPQKQKNDRNFVVVFSVVPLLVSLYPFERQSISKRFRYPLQRRHRRACFPSLYPCVVRRGHAAFSRRSLLGISFALPRLLELFQNCLLCFHGYLLIYCSTSTISHPLRSSAVQNDM